MATLKIHGLSPSTFTRTVRLACHEKGIAYEMIDAMPNTIDPLNPFRKIPAITHGDLTLYESIAILRYLERVFPGPKLWPDDAVAADLRSPARPSPLPGGRYADRGRPLSLSALRLFPRHRRTQGDRRQGDKYQPLGARDGGEAKRPGDRADLQAADCRLKVGAGCSPNGPPSSGDRP
jgi:hypothetical protein